MWTVMVGRGAGSRNIPPMVPCVPNPRLFYVNTLCIVAQFRSLAVPFGGMHLLMPSALLRPSPLPLSHFKASAFDYFDQRHSRAFPVQCRNVTLHPLLFTACIICYRAAVKYIIKQTKLLFWTQLEQK